MGTPHHVVIQLCELYVKLNWKAGFASELYVKLYWKAGLPVPNTDMCLRCAVLVQGACQLACLSRAALVIPSQSYYMRQD